MQSSKQNFLLMSLQVNLLIQLKISHSEEGVTSKYLRIENGEISMKKKTLTCMHSNIGIPYNFIRNLKSSREKILLEVATQSERSVFRSRYGWRNNTLERWDGNDRGFEDLQEVFQIFCCCCVRNNEGRY